MKISLFQHSRIHKDSRLHKARWSIEQAGSLGVCVQSHNMKTLLGFCSPDPLDISQDTFQQKSMGAFTGGGGGAGGGRNSLGKRSTSTDNSVCPPVGLSSPCLDTPREAHLLRGCAHSHSYTHSLPTQWLTVPFWYKKDTAQVIKH